MTGVMTLLSDGTAIDGDHKLVVHDGAFDATKFNWRLMSLHKKTGVYLNESTHLYEYRCFRDQKRYVIIGMCMRILQPPEFEAWKVKCAKYLEKMKNAH